MENDNGMLIISPSEIDEYIKNETNGIQNERDFVCKVKDYINGNYHRALLVTGLRSTGKTVGILQGIRGKNSSSITGTKEFKIMMMFISLEIWHSEDSHLLYI